VYLSEETKLTDHVSKESFIKALNDGPLQMEVMKGEPSNLEAALNCATKYEAYEHSLISQGTLSKSSAYTSVSDDDRPRCRSHAVNAVQGTGNDSCPAACGRATKLAGASHPLVACSSKWQVASGKWLTHCCVSHSNRSSRQG